MDKINDLALHPELFTLPSPLWTFYESAQYASQDYGVVSGLTFSLFRSMVVRIDSN